MTNGVVPPLEGGSYQHLGQTDAIQGRRGGAIVIQLAWEQ